MDPESRMTRGCNTWWK